MAVTKNEYAERITALQPRLFKTALIYTGSEYAADEILAETIYKGLKNIKKLKNDDAFYNKMAFGDAILIV